jgi:hypothetical protein
LLESVAAADEKSTVQWQTPVEQRTHVAPASPDSPETTTASTSAAPSAERVAQPSSAAAVRKIVEAALAELGETDTRARISTRPDSYRTRRRR